MAAMSSFQQSMMKAIGIHLMPKLFVDTKAFSEVLANDLFGLDGPRHLSSEYTALEFDLWRVYRAYAEVDKSTQTLRDIEFYISHFPHEDGATSPSRYLQFHAEAYISEIYILRERMTTLAKIVKRQLPRLRGSTASKETLDDLIELVTQALEPIVRTRRSHTHEARLADPEIERLGTIDLFVRFPEGGLQRAARSQAKTAERAAFKKWSRFTRENNRMIKRLRTGYERVLAQALFHKGSGYLRRAET